MWNGKSYTTKRADDKAKTPIKSQDAKPNPSNAPRPDYTSKRVEKKDGNKKTNIKKSVNKKSVNKKSTLDKVKMGRSLQRKAQASMGFKKGGRVGGCKVDGIAIRGRTRARHK